MPGYSVKSVVASGRGGWGECPSAIVNLGLGWKTRLKLLISRFKGQGSRQGGWRQSGLSGQQRTVKAEVPPLQGTSSPPEMFRQAWAALLYLYGLLFNSVNQCPEHSQLTALGIDDTEVWTEGKPM